MNRYIVEIRTMEEMFEPCLFYIFSEETKEYVNEAIKRAQKEFEFTDPYDLISYVCTAYGFKWEEFSCDMSIDVGM